MTLKFNDYDIYFMDFYAKESIKLKFYNMNKKNEVGKLVTLAATIQKLAIMTT